MSASVKNTNTPRSPGPDEELDNRVAELSCELPVESRKMLPPAVDNQVIPDELLVSLTSTCNRSTLGHTAHHRHCKSCGIRRPDAVWHHPLGRKKYKYFLEQPTSLTGAGRDISFLSDAMVTQKKTAPLPPVIDRSGVGDTQNISESLIPEEYHIVKNKGLRSLEFYEDAFTVQLQDDEQKLRVFPSLRPAGRLEVVQLTRLMEDMLEKAGVDQRTEELTELSQMEGLLELVQMEQNIYNIVFHELIRQVSVSCSERGELLAKLRQRYVTLLERIPRRLKGLHTEAVAQRALDRRLTEEIHRIKASIQQLSMELTRIRDHDIFVSQQAENAHRELADALQQTDANANVVQGYHELYELQRGRLEAQLRHMTEDRDYWSRLTFCLALKVISVKKLQLVSRLDVHEKCWSKTAKHCNLYLTSKDTADLSVIVELSDYWKEHLTDFMAQLKTTERAQCEEVNGILQGISKWLAFCNTQNKCPEPKYEKASLKKINVDLKRWSKTLALLADQYQGEKLLCCQQALIKLGCAQERCLGMSFELFRRHPCPDGEAPVGQRTMRDLDRSLSVLNQHLDTIVSGESGIHGQILSLHRLMELWVTKLSAAIGRTETMPTADCLKLEKSLHKLQSLAQEALKKFSSTQKKKEDEKDKNKPDIYAEAEKELDKVQEFITNLSNFTDAENQKLSEEVSSVHMAQTHWMLDLLLLLVPDQCQNQEEEHDYVMKNVSVHTLDEDAKMLTKRLEWFSNYITRSCKLILEEEIQQNSRKVETEYELNECKKLQRGCIDWVDTCTVLLTEVKGAAAELPVQQADPVLRVSEDTPAEATEDNECTAEEHETEQEGELTDCERPVVKIINYDGRITQRQLGNTTVQLQGSETAVLSPETDEAQKSFDDLNTVGLLQKELRDSELLVQDEARRAFKAEEALQAALEKIQDLERQLEGRTSLEPKSSSEETSSPQPPETTPSSPTTDEENPTSSPEETQETGI